MLATLFLFMSLPAAGEPISLHPDQPALPALPRQADRPDHFHRALRGGPERRLRRHPLPRRAADPAASTSRARSPAPIARSPARSRSQRTRWRPSPTSYIAPWPRSETPGPPTAATSSTSPAGTTPTSTGSRTFVAAAGERGIVVEFVLFCPFYEENLWEVNPMNARNNVNGLRAIPADRGLHAQAPRPPAEQEAFVRKAVSELNAFDNLYFEICNEPYFGGVTLEWQARIASVIVDTEKALPHKHLIAQNIANEKAKIERPDPAVSIFNFHYATPPETVGMNFGLNKVHRRRRDRLPRHPRPALSHRGVGFPRRRRRDLRPPRLLVHDRPRKRDGQGRPTPRPAAAGRRSGSSSRSSSSSSKDSTS